MLVDVHCHLDFEEFDPDRDEVVARAGDILIVNSTVRPQGIAKALQLCERYDNVRCMLGFGASDLDEDAFEAMASLIKQNRDSIVGVGEVGLDHYWVKDERGRQVQRGHLAQMVSISRELALPLLVHSRDAESECINILEEHKARAIMHCFSGSIEDAFRAAKIGCLLSIPCNVTYSRGRQELVKALPLECMVLESDAPYLGPRKGERNEPANVRTAAEKIAELKGVDAGMVEEATTGNALAFIGLKNG